ncbi:MAG: hypothetical protein ACLGIR_08615 [Actinomycetes bacterium]|jgi:hypothetical protein
MSAPAALTIVAVALAVVAIAAYLLHVIWLLHRTSFALGTIVAGLRAIAYQTRPIGPVVDSINGDLAATREALEGVLGTSLPTGRSRP